MEFEKNFDSSHQKRSYILKLVEIRLLDFAVHAIKYLPIFPIGAALIIRFETKYQDLILKLLKRASNHLIKFSDDILIKLIWFLNNLP